MKKKINFLIFGLFLALFLIFLSFIVSATSIIAPYLKIHCDINISFIESNFCESENCSPKVSKEPLTDYWYHIDNVRIYKEGEIHFGYNYEDYKVNKVRKYNFTDAAGEFLKKACKEDISPLLKYIKENNFTEDYYDFYPAGTEFKQKYYSLKPVEGLDGWYLREYYLTKKQIEIKRYAEEILLSLFLVPMLIYLIVMIALINFPVGWIILITVMLILIYLFKKKKVSIFYMWPLLLGFLGGLIGYFICKDKKIRKRLLITGLIVSLFLFLFFWVVGWFGQY